jgi:predicted amino acid-binding ACT domain protein
VFVTPLRGDKEIAAAADLGFNVSSSIKAVRVEGENKPAIAAGLMEKLAAAGLNLRGFSAAVIATRFIFYIGFDTSEDAAKAVSILQSV